MPSPVRQDTVNSLSHASLDGAFSYNYCSTERRRILASISFMVPKTMSTEPIADAWQTLVAAVLKVCAGGKELPAAKKLPFGLPEPLNRLYSATGGLKVTGYLPDKIGGNQMSYSLMPASQVISTRSHMISLSEEGEAEWSAGWYPFAEDGASGYLVVDEDSDWSVCQYDGGSWQSERCANSLARFFQDVAAGIKSGKLKPFMV